MCIEFPSGIFNLQSLLTYFMLKHKIETRQDSIQEVCAQSLSAEMSFPSLFTFQIRNSRFVTCRCNQHNGLRRWRTFTTPLQVATPFGGQWTLLQVETEQRPKVFGHRYCSQTDAVTTYENHDLSCISLSSLSGNNSASIYNLFGDSRTWFINYFTKEDVLSWSPLTGDCSGSPWAPKGRYETFELSSLLSRNGCTRAGSTRDRIGSPGADSTMGALGLPLFPSNYTSLSPMRLSDWCHTRIVEKLTFG